MALGLNPPVPISFLCLFTFLIISVTLISCRCSTPGREYYSMTDEWSRSLIQECGHPGGASVAGLTTSHRYRGDREAH